ncbi:MAG: CvpA family protein [Clostridia bacterium]|nr:CvpA family protein [Clostridia bacterium]
MSLADWVVLMFLAVYAVFGAYRGFCTTLFKSIGFFISWVAAYLLHPFLSMILGRTGFLKTVISLTEGSNKISAAFVQYVYQPVAGMNSATLNSIVDTSELVSPFTNLVKRNLVGQLLSDKGVQTVGEYFDYTVGYAALNIISFLLMFFICRMVWHLFVNLSDAQHSFPVLRHYDSSVGALTGFLRGIFDGFAWAMLIPVGLTILGMPAITAYIKASPVMNFFYSSNFLLILMRGVIW